MSRRVVRMGMNMEWVLLVNWSIGIEVVGVHTVFYGSLG